MHRGWGRMVFFKRLAILKKARDDKKTKEITYEVKIAQESILEDLKSVFINTTGYRDLFLKLFEDISRFDFDNCNSVSDEDTEREDFRPSKYGKVNLKDHSIDTFKKMLFLLQQDSKYTAQKDIFLAIALLHDFGKSHELCETYGISRTYMHNVRSAKYFRKLIEENDIAIDEISANIIYRTLEMHHANMLPDKEKTTFLRMLRKADGLTRKDEEIKYGKSV